MFQLVGCSRIGVWGGFYTGWVTPLVPTAQAYLGATTCQKYQEKYGTDPRGYPNGPAAGHPDIQAPRIEKLPTLHATIAPDARAVDPREVARWAWVQRRSAHGKGDGFHGGNDTHKIDDDAPAAVISLLPTLPATIAPDARAVDPREVARWVALWPWCYRQGDYHSGGPVLPDDRRQDATATATGLSRTPTLPATIAPDACAIDPGPCLPPGTVCYMDPPYVATTGYAHDLPRPEVVALARRWAAAGAIVCISEAEPIPELVEEGWHAVEITDNRKGQKRTFSKQQKEWLTMNQPPTYGTGPVFDMFG